MVFTVALALFPLTEAILAIADSTVAAAAGTLVTASTLASSLTLEPASNAPAGASRTRLFSVLNSVGASALTVTSVVAEPLVAPGAAAKALVARDIVATKATAAAKIFFFIIQFLHVFFINKALMPYLPLKKPIYIGYVHSVLCLIRQNAVNSAFGNYQTNQIVSKSQQHNSRVYETHYRKGL